MHAATLLLVGTLAAVEPARVLPPGELPADVRLGPPKSLNGYFPFAPPPSREAWNSRAQRLRRQLLLASGLWPMPTATPAAATAFGAVERPGYTVERVILQSYPGHYVTGSLYRPTGKIGRLPGVLCPHGHWPEGRFYDAGPKAIRQSIVEGAERFERSGRHPLQARCAQLARMGCVVFHYDMIGYADSVQLAHRAGVRDEMNTARDWGFFSPQAELRLQSVMGLQTYNSVRALDWLSGRDDVDPKRIGVTGASGGGTQTFLLAAIDPRPTVAFPAVMVSTAMQGGCPCENGCYLRVETGNIEIAGLTAPRPLGMVAANDWTKEIETKGLPELQRLYGMLGVPDRVMCRALVHFPHNYNYVSRAVMYGWMNRHLRLGLPEPVVEDDFVPLTKEELTVWDADHPRPTGGDDYERSLLRWMTADAEQQLRGLVPAAAAGLDRYREVVGGAVQTLIGRELPAPAAISGQKIGEASLGGVRLERLRLRYDARGEELPALLLKPAAANGTVAVWISTGGKAGLFDGGKPRAAVDRLLAAGIAVLGVDLIGQGEFTADGQAVQQARLLPPDGKHAWQRYAGFTFGYNYPLFVQRVHDVLTAIAYARDAGGGRVLLVGLEGAGHWALAARAVAGPAVARAAVETAGFRFSKLSRFDDPDFLPGGAKYLDLPGMASLSAPGPLWIADAADGVELVGKVYRAAGASEALADGSSLAAAARPAAALEWLLAPR